LNDEQRDFICKNGKPWTTIGNKSGKAAIPLKSFFPHTVPFRVYVSVH